MNKIYSIVIIIIILAGIYYILPKGSPVPSTSDAATGTSTTTPLTTSSTTEQTTMNQAKNFMNKVTIETNKGKIVFETYDQDAPKTVANFITLANKGFYNGTIFHRVINSFMIQGGDPTGTGMGGPGYNFADELSPATESYKAGYVRGTVAMANSGPDTNGSQFFIMQADNQLPHSYSIFGKVISGLEVVDAIAHSKTGPQDRPVEKIVMTKVTVEQLVK